MTDLSLFSPKRILVCQLRQIGDVLLATPSIRLLKQRYPAADIDVLTEKKCSTVLHNNPNIDRIWTIDKKKLKNPLKALKFYAKVGRSDYDLIVDFQQLPRCKWVIRFSSAPVKLTHTPPWYNRFLYTHWIQREGGYAAKCKASTLAPLGIEWHSEKPELYLSEDERLWAQNYVSELNVHGMRLVTLDPSHRRETRRWPKSYFAKLMQELSKHCPDVSFILTYGPGELEIANEVNLLAGKLAIIPDRVLTLREMAAIQELSALHIGNCSAPRHFAVAVNTPSITIQGATSRAWRYPSDDHVSVAKDLECQFCNSNTCSTRECLTTLTPDEVLHEAIKLLEK